MMKRDKLDRFVQEFSSMLPEDLRQARTDLEKNIKAALQATFSRMDLVTREELEVQKELLSRTRTLLEELRARVEELEQQQESSGQEK